MTATTLFGLEEILAGEIRELGAKDIQIINRAVRFIGDQELMYKSNLKLRTALKILKSLVSFKAHNDQQLYRQAKQIGWEDHFSFRQSFAIDSVTFGKTFKHSRYAALKVKDAIADRFREKFGIRPSVDPNIPDINISLHIADKQCSLSLNSSGQTLNRRGYRQDQSEAPINEVLAAGMIILSGWDKKSHLYDPMCGSATIPIEAATIAANIAPGLLRSFGFQAWQDYDESLWLKVKKQVEEESIECSCQIHGSEIDQKVFEKARRNVRRAGLANLISLKKEDFFQKDRQFDSGLILMNPPYGERLENDRSINQLYGNIGTRLKHNFEGWDAWIISGNLEALKHIGLKPSEKIKLFNGALECRFNKYELYRGSKKVTNDG
jgi:putative N6-adenine-specific DNA methylase